MSCYKSTLWREGRFDTQNTCPVGRRCLQDARMHDDTLEIDLSIDNIHVSATCTRALRSRHVNYCLNKSEQNFESFKRIMVVHIDLLVLPKTGTPVAPESKS